MGKKHQPLKRISSAAVTENCVRRVNPGGAVRWSDLNIRCLRELTGIALSNWLDGFREKLIDLLWSPADELS
jgi:hypothetical protein